MMMIDNTYQFAIKDHNVRTEVDKYKYTQVCTIQYILHFPIRKSKALKTKSKDKNSFHLNVQQIVYKTSHFTLDKLDPRMKECKLPFFPHNPLIGDSGAADYCRNIEAFKLDVKFATNLPPLIEFKYFFAEFFF